MGVPGLNALAAFGLAALAGPLLLVVIVVVGAVQLLEERLCVGRHVPVVEERVLLQPDVDERRLKVVLEVLHDAPEDGANEPLLLRVFHHVLLELVVLEHGHARLELLDVDDDLPLERPGLEPVCDGPRHLFDDCLYSYCHCFSPKWLSGFVVRRLNQPSSLLWTATLCTSPRAAMTTTRNVRPALISGSGSPVIGMRPMDIAMLT